MHQPHSQRLLSRMPRSFLPPTTPPSPPTPHRFVGQPLTPSNPKAACRPLRGPSAWRDVSYTFIPVGISPSDLPFLLSFFNLPASHALTAVCVSSFRNVHPDYLSPSSSVCRIRVPKARRRPRGTIGSACRSTPPVARARTYTLIRKKRNDDRCTRSSSSSSSGSGSSSGSSGQITGVAVQLSSL